VRFDCDGIFGMRSGSGGQAGAVETFIRDGRSRVDFGWMDRASGEWISAGVVGSAVEVQDWTGSAVRGFQARMHAKHHEPHKSSSDDVNLHNPHLAPT